MRRAPPPPSAARRGLGDHLVRAVGVLLLLSSLGVGLFRAPDRPVETLVARWAPAPSVFLDFEGQLVHLRDEGWRDDPAPLVLLHGRGGSLHTWEGWVAALRTQRRVITLDLPGFGLTGPTEAADYRPEADAAFVLRLLAHLGVPRFVAGGQGLGGEVAWRMAATAPQRVQRLILVDATGYGLPAQVQPPGLVMAGAPLLQRVGEHLLPRAMVADTLAQAVGDASRLTDTQIDRYYEMALREGNRRALAQRLAQPDTGADAARIAGLRLPTLVLWGERDRLVPPAAAERFARDIPGSTLVRFPMLGHLPQEEDPSATVAAVKAFLGLR